MPTPRIFVVRVIRRTGSTEVHGVVEHASSRKRVTFRTADGLWRAVAGPAARSKRAGPDERSEEVAVSSLYDVDPHQRFK